MFKELVDFTASSRICFDDFLLFLASKEEEEKDIFLVFFWDKNCCTPNRVQQIAYPYLCYGWTLCLSICNKRENKKKINFKKQKQTQHYHVFLQSMRRIILHKNNPIYCQFKSKRRDFVLKKSAYLYLIALIRGVSISGKRHPDISYRIQRAPRSV